MQRTWSFTNKEFRREKKLHPMNTAGSLPAQHHDVVLFYYYSQFCAHSRQRTCSCENKEFAENYYFYFSRRRVVSKLLQCSCSRSRSTARYGTVPTVLYRQPSSLSSGKVLLMRAFRLSRTSNTGYCFPSLGRCIANNTLLFVRLRTVFFKHLFLVPRVQSEAIVSEYCTEIVQCSVLIVTDVVLRRLLAYQYLLLLQ